MPSLALPGCGVIRLQAGLPAVKQVRQGWNDPGLEPSRWAAAAARVPSRISRQGVSTAAACKGLLRWGEHAALGGSLVGSVQNGQGTVLQQAGSHLGGVGPAAANKLDISS